MESNLNTNPGRMRQSEGYWLMECRQCKLLELFHEMGSRMFGHLAEVIVTLFSTKPMAYTSVSKFGKVFGPGSTAQPTKKMT